MVRILAGGTEKPEREEVVEPLVEPDPERRRERREEQAPAKIPKVEPEKIPVSGEALHTGACRRSQNAASSPTPPGS